MMKKQILPESADNAVANAELEAFLLEQDILTIVAFKYFSHEITNMIEGTRSSLSFLDDPKELEALFANSSDQYPLFNQLFDQLLEIVLDLIRIFQERFEKAQKIKIPLGTFDRMHNSFQSLLITSDLIPRVLPLATINQRITSCISLIDSLLLISPTTSPAWYPQDESGPFVSARLKNAQTRLNDMSTLLQLCTKIPSADEVKPYDISESIRTELMTRSFLFGLPMSLQIEPDIAIMALPLEIRLILTNVVKNAAEAMGCSLKPESKEMTPIDPPENSPLLEVSLTKTGNANSGFQAQLRFKDNGPGIEQGLLDHLASGTGVSTKGADRGRGIAINKNLVKSRGGTYEIAPNEGSPGISVTITFPLTS